MIAVFPAPFAAGVLWRKHGMWVTTRHAERPSRMIGHHAAMTATAGQAGWTWAQTALLLAAIIAFVSTTIAAAITYGLNQRGARRERRARSFAEALSAVEDYAELPYRIRRRPGGVDARHQLTEQISAVQSRIAFYQAWLRIEAPEVSTAYEALVQAAKEQAGGEMKQAWRQNIRKKDRDMNLGAAYPRDRINRELERCLITMRGALNGKRFSVVRRVGGRTRLKKGL